MFPTLLYVTSIPEGYRNLTSMFCLEIYHIIIHYTKIFLRSKYTKWLIQHVKSYPSVIFPSGQCVLTWIIHGAGKTSRSSLFSESIRTKFSCDLNFSRWRVSKLRSSGLWRRIVYQQFESICCLHFQNYDGKWKKANVFEMLRPAY